MSAKSDAERQAEARQRRANERAQLMTMVAGLQKENAALRAENTVLTEKLHRAQLRLARATPTSKR